MQPFVIGHTRILPTGPGLFAIEAGMVGVHGILPAAVIGEDAVITVATPGIPAMVRLRRLPDGGYVGLRYVGAGHRVLAGMQYAEEIHAAIREAQIWVLHVAARATCWVN